MVEPALFDDTKYIGVPDYIFGPDAAGTRCDILVGDCREMVAGLDAESIDCCITSPPYWGLRDYGTAGQLGLESTPDEYVEKLVALFADVRRVLRPAGTLWLNLGDSYAGGGTIGRNDTTPAALARRAARYGTGTGTGSAVGAQGSRPAAPGLKPKDLVGIPWRVAFALQADGWYLRSDIIWHKPNPMPESTTDRPTKSHEYIFLMSKSPQYFYDAAAIAEPAVTAGGPAGYAGYSSRAEAMGRAPSGNEKPGATATNKTTRNSRTVWTIPVANYAAAHFATFPPDLIVPCVLAGCPLGGTILDPFFGAGTTGLVAKRLGRHCVGVELNDEYAELARGRIKTNE